MEAEPFPDWDIDVSKKVTPQIARILRERIIQNDLKPTDRLSEAELASFYNVSRQPVREALIRLSFQGLVEVRPQRGTFVTKIDYYSVLDARFLREAIEADICKILAAQCDAALVKDLKSQIKKQKDIPNTGLREFSILDERFHRTLAEAAGKGGAWRQIEGLKSQMDRVRYLALTKVPVKKLIGQHEVIADQIEKGDVAATNLAIRTHLRQVLSDLPLIIKANSEFFNLPKGEIPMPENAPILERTLQGGNFQ